MPKRAIKYPTRSMMSFPGNRHYHSFGPGAMLSAERCSCQNLITRIDVHVILLGAILEIAKAGGNRVISVRDAHAIGKLCFQDVPQIGPQP